jgi:hypothetical protein
VLCCAVLCCDVLGSQSWEGLTGEARSVCVQKSTAALIVSAQSTKLSFLWLSRRHRRQRECVHGAPMQWPPCAYALVIKCLCNGHQVLMNASLLKASRSHRSSMLVNPKYSACSLQLLRAKSLLVCQTNHVH